MASCEDIERVLTELGLSRAAAQDMYRKAAAEAEARVLPVERRAARAQVPYLQWLRAVSPEYNWEQKFQALIAAHLDAIIAGKIRRLAIFLPPCSGKSVSTTIRFPVYAIERDPERLTARRGYPRFLPLRLLVPR